MRFISRSLALLRRSQLLAVIFCLPLLASAAETRAWLLLMENPDAAQSVLSTNEDEKNNLVAAGWKVTGEGVVTFEAAEGKAMVYRLVRVDQGVARRLAVTEEKLALDLKDGFVSEGAMGYVFLNEVPGGVPVYRFSKGDLFIWVSGPHEQYWADHNGWTRESGTFWLGAAE